MLRYQQWLAHPLGQSFPGSPLFIKIQLAINTINALVVPGVRLPAYGSETFPEAPRGMGLNNCSQDADNIGVAFCIAL